MLRRVHPLPHGCNGAHRLCRADGPYRDNRGNGTHRADRNDRGNRPHGCDRDDRLRRADVPDGDNGCNGSNRSNGGNGTGGDGNDRTEHQRLFYTRPTRSKQRGDRT